MSTASAAQAAVQAVSPDATGSQCVASVLQQLQQRDERESKPFADVFARYSNLLSSHVALQLEFSNLRSKHADAENQCDVLAAELEVARRNSNGSGGSGSRDGSGNKDAQVAELVQQIAELQAKLAAEYKQRADSADELLFLQRTMSTQLEAIQEKTRGMDLLRKEVDKVRAQLQAALDDVKGRDEAVQLLGAENAALKQALGRQEEVCKTVTRENQDLVARLVELKNTEAERMNDMLGQLSGKQAEKVRASMLEEAMSLGMKTAELEAMDGSVASLGRSASRVLIPSDVRSCVPAHSDEITSLAYSATGTILATGSADKTVKLWDSRTGMVRATLSGSINSVTCVAFSSDDRLVLGGGADNAIRFWNCATGRSRFTMTGHMGKVTGAVFASTNSKVVSGSADRTLKIWDLNKGFCVKTILCFSSCNDVAVSLDSSLAASAHLDNNVRLWDVRTGAEFATIDNVHMAAVTSVRVSNDGFSILTNCRDNVVRVFDLRTHSLLTSLSHDGYRTGPLSRATWGADDQFVASCSADTVFLWSIDRREVVSMLKGQKDLVTSAWSPNGVQLACVDRERNLILWE